MARSQFEGLLENPSLNYLVSVLANGIPGQSQLFTNYIITQVSDWLASITLIIPITLIRL